MRKSARNQRRVRRRPGARSRFFDSLEPRLLLAAQPLVSYSTYFGGVRNETVSDIAVNLDGDTYVIGDTTSPLLGGESSPDSGTQRAFLAKFNSQGVLEGATILGPTPQFDAAGYAASNGFAVAVDASNRVLVAYETFETTTAVLAAGGFIPMSGEHFLHIKQLTDDGPIYDVTAPVFNQPGIFPAFGFSAVHLATDSTGAAYVTYSAFRPTAGGGVRIEPYLTKISPVGAIEFTASLYGDAAGIAVDRFKNIYVAISTRQPDLPTTPGALQAGPHPGGFAGSSEIWIGMFDPTASSLLGATYLGGSHIDTVAAIAVDPESRGLVYLVGKTLSDDFPLKTPYQTLPSAAPGVGVDSRANAFLSLVDLDVTVDQPSMLLLSSTYLGGGREEYLSDVAIDAAGAVYVVGATNSSDFPTVGPLQPAWQAGPLFDVNGGKVGVNRVAQDLVIAKFDRLLRAPLFSTYYGGSGHDFVPQVALDLQGNIHLAASSAGVMFSPVEEIGGRIVDRADPFVPTADFPTIRMPDQQHDFGGGDIGVLENLATDAVIVQLAQGGVLVGQGARVSWGKEFDHVVAEFASPAPFASSADFTATIDWGDGSISPGVIRRIGTRLAFAVHGRHRYDRPGAFPVVVRVESRAEENLPPVRNINVSHFDLGQTGGAIAVDPSDPNRMFAATSDEQSESPPGRSRNGGLVVATSHDGGATWSPRRMGNADRPPELASRARPDALFDRFGNLFLAYQGAAGNEIIVALSTDGGLTFDPSKAIRIAAPGSAPDFLGPPTVGSPKLAFGGPHDELWVTFEDRSGNQLHAAGAVVNATGDVGEFFLQPVAGSPSIGDSDVAVGPDGTVVVTWDDDSGLVASRDTDGIGPAVFTLPAEIDADAGTGAFTTAAQSSPVAVHPTLAWDLSDGPHHGRLYAAYVAVADEAAGALGPKELTLFTSFSDDHGAHWSSPRRVTNDPLFQSMFLPSLAVDSFTGALAVGWYATRGFAGTTATTANFYVSGSNDGETFSEPQTVSAEASNGLDMEMSDVARAIGYGEPPSMAYWNGRLFPLWSDNSSLDGENRSAPNFEVATSIVGVFQVETPPVAIRPQPIQAVAGAAFSGAVASFTHPDASLRPLDYLGTTTIYWGDGGRSSGEVSQPGGPGTEFIVSGNHTYVDAGAYPLWISVFDQAHRLDAVPVSNVSAQQGSQAEGTIAIDPSNTDRVFAASNDLSEGASRGITVATSDDGGVTWSSRTIANGADELPPTIGDPKAVFDRFGNLFLTYITPSPDRNTVLLLSINGGADFTVLKVFTDVDPVDQPSVAVGPGGDAAQGSVWLTWERGESLSQVIMAAGASVHGLGAVGLFAEHRVAPTAFDAQYRNFGDIAVGPNGQVLVAYQTGNPTAAAGPAELVVHLDPDGLGPQPFGPAILASSVNIGPNLRIPAQFERTIDAEGNLAWDRSDGEHRGRVYLVYTDSPAVGGADTNVFIRYSDDNGLHWGEPIQVHDDSVLDQFLPSVAVDPSSGNVGVGWYTTVNPENTATRFTATISDDGGSTFRLAHLLSPGDSDATHDLLDARSKRFQYGDYTVLSFVDGVVQPIWADNSDELESNPDLPQFDLANARVAIAEVSRALLEVRTVDITDFEGSELTKRLAAFTDPGGALPAAKYRASIDWGDGAKPSDGTIEAQPDGSFAVFGTHEYQRAGRFAARISILGPRTHGEGALTAVIENAPLDLTVPGGQRVVREKEFTQVVGLLADLNRHSKPEDFIVTIEWGDGTGSLATLRLQDGSGQDGNPNYFNVSGSHKYLTEKQFTINISVRERATGMTLSATGELVSGDPTLRVEPGLFLDIAALAGINTGDLELVTFTREDGVEVPLDTSVGEYTATINWGDGQVTDHIRPFVTSEDVTVVGRHTYATAGQYFPYVTLQDDSGGFFYAPLIAMVDADATPRIRALGSGLVYDPLADQFVGELNITNVSSTDISGPLFVIIHDLPAGVTLDSAPDVTGEGDPLLKIEQSKLPAGASLPAIPLAFSNPGRVPISYRVQLFDSLRPELPGGAGLAFEPNQGQADDGVAFLARGQGFTIGLSAAHAALSVGAGRAGAAAAFMEIVGASAAAAAVPAARIPGVSNYFVGDQTIANVPHFGRVRFSSVYSGVDIEYYGRDGLLEYDWVVRPGADPSAIAMRFRGVDRMALDQAGNLRLQIHGGELVQRAPLAYQFVGGIRRDVLAEFELNADGTVGFALGSFDASAPLVIDPVLVYSTYLGGSGGESANSVAVDAAGNTYVAGFTGSLDFFTARPFDPELNQPDTSPLTLSRDAFVTKFDPTGALVYSTYLGGGAHGFGFPSDTIARSIAVDAQGRVWVGGETQSLEFPRTTAAPSAFPPRVRPDTGGDGFLAQLASDGAALVYSTTLGMHGILDLAVDGAGMVYAIGLAGIQSALSGEVTADGDFVLKLDPANNAAVYLRKHGGELGVGNGGVPKGIAVDDFGQAYIAGFTDFIQFPAKNAIFPTLRTRRVEGPDGPTPLPDGYVLKLLPDGRTAFATLLGNTNVGSASDIALDPTGAIYVVGVTESDAMPTPGGLQTVRKGGADVYLVKLANDGQTILYGTYLGGSASDLAYGIAVDEAGRAYLAGSTASVDFPVAVKAHQPDYRGGPHTGSLSGVGDEGFAAAIEADGRSFKYLTYLGGSQYDEARAVAVDAVGNASFVGVTQSPDLIASQAVQPRLAAAGGVDAFVFRLLASDAGTIELHQAPFTVTEGSEWNGLVAFFTTTGTETADQFSATIDWGDGASSPGTIVGNHLSGFQVLGRHFYTDQIGPRDFFVTLRDSLGRTVTAMSTPSSTSAAGLYHVSIDAAALTGTPGLLSLQFNPGSALEAPNATARISALNLFGGSLGASTLSGDAAISAPGEFTLRPTDLLNRALVNVTLGGRLEFDVSLTGLPPRRSGSFSDVFAVQLLSADGTASLLDADQTESLLRIELSADGSTRVGSIAGAVTAAASGRATVANAPIDLSLSPFSVQEGREFNGAVAAFANGNPFETAGQFTAMIDWGDGAPPSPGQIAGGHGAFTVIGSHVYQRLGSYRLTVTVTDPDGAVVRGESGRDILAASQFNSFQSLPSAVVPPVVGDFTGDGILDVAVAGSTYVPSFSGPGVGILRGKGDGSFEFAGFRLTGGNPLQLAAADFNRDGQLDVAVSIFNFGPNVVELLLGNGDGTLRPASRLTELTNPTYLAAADFNRDGNADLAYVAASAPAAGTNGNQLKVALGRGDGTFVAPTSTAVKFATHAIRVADMTGDSLPDVVLSSVASGQTEISLVRGLGDGAFAAPATVAAGLPFASLATSTALDDLDRDGNQDIAFIAFGSLRVFSGAGDGTFRAPQAIAAANGSSIATADLNGDGLVDLAVGEGAAANDPGRVRVYWNDGATPFATSARYEGVTSPRSVVVADFDRDGHVDVAASGAGSVISVLSANGDGGLASAVRYATGLSEPTNFLVPRSALSGDLNGDGRSDAVMVMSDGRLVTQIGLGNGAFQSILAGNAGFLSFFSSLLADLNQDGKLDVVSVNQGGDIFSDFSGVSVSLGLGDGKFESRRFTPLPPVNPGFTTNPEDVAVGDLNGDGRLDLAVSIRFATAILFGDGGGGFQAPLILRPPSFLGIGDRSSRVGIADADGDGDRDLVTFHPASTDGSVAIWRNNGAGIFDAPVVRKLGLTTNTFDEVDLETGDVNGDGRMDVVVADTGNRFDLASSGGINVMLGAGDGTLAQPVRYLVAPRRRPYRLLLTDLSGDGRPEIVSPVSANGDFAGDPTTGIAVLTNDGQGRFDEVRIFDPGGLETGYAAAGDFSGDGLPDIIVPDRANYGSTFGVIFSGARPAIVTDAPVTVTGENVNPRVGLAFTTTVATFVDENPFGQASDFSATINWGDGQTSAGAISVDPRGGFAVAGSHSYAAVGQFTTTITLVETGEGTHVGSGVARVSSVDQALAARGVNFDAMVGIPFAGVVATLIDADPNGSLADFSALIRWGDGQTTTGIMTMAAGGFAVSGAHAYASDGPFLVQVDIADIAGGAASAASTAQVSPRANQTPAARNDEYEAIEDEPLTVDALLGVLANDEDLDLDRLSARIVLSPEHGTLILAGDGSFRYVPAANYFGADRFSYRTSDGRADSNVADVTITVRPVNDPPSAADDFANVNEDDAVAINVLANDLPGDGLIVPATVALIDPPAHGTVRVDAASGLLTYTPVANFAGADRIRYRVADANGQYSNIGSVSIIVAPANDVPVAVADHYLTNEGSPLSVARSHGLLANDSDADAEPLSALVVTAPAHGTLTLGVDGSFSYIPAADFFGVDRFEYRAADGTANSTPAAVVIVVGPANDSPRVAALTDQTIDEGASLQAIGSFTDAETDDQWTATIDYGDGAGVQPLTLAGQTFALDHRYRDSGDYVAVVRVADQSGAAGEQALRVRVRNLAPAVQTGPDQAIGEGALVHIVATFVDAGVLDGHAATVNWGDGSPDQVVPVISASGAGRVVARHAYADEGSYLVVVRVTDHEGGVGSDTLTVTATNAPPQVEAGLDRTVTAGQAVVFPDPFAVELADSFFGPVRLQFLAGSFLDAGANDRHTAEVDWGDGVIENVPLDERSLPAANGAASVSGVVLRSHVYRTAGSFVATIRVDDGDGGVGVDSFIVTVNPGDNTPPTLTGVPSQVRIPEQQPYTFTATAADNEQTSENLAFSLVGAPEGASIDPRSGRFSWTPTEEQGPGVYAFEVQVSDGIAATSRPIVITVVDDQAHRVVNANDSGPGSLRQAILDAGLSPGHPHAILFEIPGGGAQRIEPLSPLPGSTDPLIANLSGAAGAQNIVVGEHSAFSWDAYPSLTLEAGGFLTLAGPFAFVPNTVIQVASGASLALASDAAGNLDVHAAGLGSSVQFLSTQHLRGLNLSAGADAELAVGGRLLALKSLLVDAAQASLLDLTDGALVLDYSSGASPLVQVTQYLAAGYNPSGATWDGAGVMSRVARDDPSFITSLGVIDNREVGYDTVRGREFGYSLPNGEPLPADAVLVKFTYVGDADLNGRVDGDDLVSMLVGYANGLRAWDTGDFDYNGIADGADLTSLLVAYINQGAPLAASGFALQPVTASTAPALPPESPAPPPLARAVDEPAADVHDLDEGLLRLMAFDVARRKKR